MGHVKHGNRASVVWRRVLVALLLLLTGTGDAAASQTAQEKAEGGLWSMGIGARTVEAGVYEHTVGARFIVTSEEGEYIGECTLDEPPDVGVAWWNCRVDVPSDRISLVWEDLDSIPAGYAPVENPIVFDPTAYETGPHNIGAIFDNVPISGTTSMVAQANGSANVAIYTVENDLSAYDVCYVLVGYSNEGCDRNADGKVTFADIPYGTYTVQQTADLGPGRTVPDFTITVTGNVNSEGYEGFTATIVNTGGSGSSASSNVAIVTTENGQPAYDACYVFVGYSNEGCDRNADGMITFEDIPLGTWTVRQTADLGPNRSVADFTVQVTGAMDGDGWERFPATIVTTGGGSSSGPKDISLITRDPGDGHLLTDTCYILLDYSNEGCDRNGDGQVTFDAMPPGTYTVRQTQTPAGYPTINDFPITIDDRFPNVPVGYLVRQAPEQNTASTRNVSVIFVDADTRAKIVPASICLQFANVSIVGCDRDLVDGQVDFLDLAVGTHDVAFSNVPSGWQILADPSATITGGPGPQLVYMQVHTGNGSGSGSGGATTETGAIAVIGGDQAGDTSSGTAPDGTTTTGPAVELILDTSGSMNERDQGNQTRMEVAKTVTTRLVTETLPAGVPMALRTYSGCSSSLAIPMQPLDPNAASSTIANLRASGSTPIGQSLRAASADLADIPGPKIIVLVTDGEETCGGDPRAAIEALVAQDVNVHVNIVGFAIDDAELTATFQEWARVGNGTYFEASNALELDQAVTTASQLSFRVLDAQGTVIATGVVGGDPVSVPVGTYTVEVNTAPMSRFENVVVTAQQTTTIDLDASGTTSGGGDATTGDQGQNDQAVVPGAPQDDDAGIAGTETTETVGDDGFTLTLDGVSVSGDSDVAPGGTTVRARLIQQDLPDAVSGFAESIGTGVEITLGEGLQPASPLTITFSADVVTEWYAAADADSDLLPVVFASRDDGLGVELADAELLPDGSVVVTADHLSWFQSSLASVSGFTGWLDEQVSIFMQVRSNSPDCVNHLAADLGWKFSAVPDQLVWPCAARTQGGLEVTLKNNSPHVWLVSSEQAASGASSSTLSLSGMVLTAMSGLGIDRTTTPPLIPPDGVVTFQIDEQQGPIVFDAVINEQMTVVNAFVSVLSVVLPDKKIQALGRAQCFIDAVSASFTAEDDLEEGAVGGFAGTIFRCVGAVGGGLGGTLISTVAVAPGALTALADGAMRELTGNDAFSITLSRTDGVTDDPAGPSSNAWPVDRSDGPPSLYIWLGASTAWPGATAYGVPDWVACDDARAYCLVGYPGREHLLVQMNGLSVVGTVDDAAPDPRQALLALGLSSDIVAQILGAPGGAQGTDADITAPQDGAQEGNDEGSAPDGAQGGDDQAIVPIVPDGSQGSAAPAQDDDMVSVSVAVSISCHEMAPCDDVIYVPLTFATENGDALGTCTVTVDPQLPLPGCSVEVPAGMTVVITEDVSALPAGYVPTENPIYLDTANIEPAQYDAGFHNVYQGANDTTDQTSGGISPSDPDGSTSTTQDTWTASVQVNLCDAPPNSGLEMNCQAGPGVVVNISLASGEWMGSCSTSEPTPTPWDVYISTCVVEGMPFNADFVATQDPATIPAGYAPHDDTLSLRVDDLIPGGGDQATFTFFNVRTDGGASTSDSTGSSASAVTVDPMSLLPSIAEVPGGLVETGRQTRTLPDVAANYTDPAETTQLFTTWGWQGNAVASFALPSGQQAQSGQVNGVYVSIHQFGDPDAARAALDFSIVEQAAGTSLQEVTTRPIGEYTRALYGSEVYGNETTVLVQQGNVLIRVSASMLDGDPTEATLSVTEAILLKVGSGSATGSASSSTAGSATTPDTGNPVITTDSSGSAITPSSGGAGQATLLMTFRGCPEGFDPNSGNFHAACTVPLDAPDASVIAWGGDGQGGMSITGLDRQYNGEYVHNAGPGTMNITLSGMAPIVRDGYTVVGADGASGDTYTVNLVDGETREVYVFYWFN